ncbi:uncharacterized protein LOC144916510 isoform X2 [Branchiostoma floridae x Branchiostoma belcheri]
MPLLTQTLEGYNTSTPDPEVLKPCKQYTRLLGRGLVLSNKTTTVPVRFQPVSPANNEAQRGRIATRNLTVAQALLKLPVRKFRLKFTPWPPRIYMYSSKEKSTTVTEDLEDLITRNRVLLTKRLQVSDLFPLLIQKGLLQIHEKEDISSRTTRQGKAEALLDVLSQQGKCTCDEFKEVLTSGNHDHIVGQLK